MKLFTTKPKWYHFWNPWTGFTGGLLFLVVIILACAAFEAIGDTEFDETVNGYSGYDYETREHIEVTEDPTGGYDVYNYETFEYSDIEPNPTGGFTIYFDD